VCPPGEVWVPPPRWAAAARGFSSGLWRFQRIGLRDPSRRGTPRRADALPRHVSGPEQPARSKRPSVSPPSKSDHDPGCFGGPEPMTEATATAQRDALSPGSDRGPVECRDGVMVISARMVSLLHLLATRTGHSWPVPPQTVTVRALVRRELIRLARAGDDPSALSMTPAGRALHRALCTRCRGASHLLLPGVTGR